MPAGTTVAKNPKNTHPKSIYRDALSAQVFERLAATGDLGLALETLVTVDADKRSKWKPGSGAFSKTRTTPCKRWLDTVHPTSRAYTTATPWRDAKQPLKLQMAHLVLAMEGDVISFTLNLGVDIEAKALAKNCGAKDWLGDRMKHHLAAALGRDPHFWFNLEMGEGKSPYLHLHGEIGCSDAEKILVREGLRKVGGRYLGKKQFQIKFGKEPPDTGWLSYAAKPDLESLKAKACQINGGATRAPSWRDRRVYIEQGLSRKAQRLYNDNRNLLAVKTTPIRSLM